MILDERNEFADATALNTGAAGTYVIGDQIDLGNVRDIGNGADITLVINVATGINAAAAGTVQFQLVSADNGALTTNPVVHAQTGAFVTSTTSGNAGGALAAGTTLVGMVLPTGVDYKRYVGIRQVTGTAAVTAGAVDAFLTLDATRWRAYADAVN
jgi:hypothetical protein